MKKSSTQGWIVMWDDGQGLCVPMGFDADCKGALEGGSGDIAIFETPLQARLAIRLSTAWASLQSARGEAVNEDFTTSRKHLKIRRLRAWTR